VVCATPCGKCAYIVSVACGVVLVVELTLFLALRERFIAVSHGVAAVTMVAGSSRCWGSARCEGEADAMHGEEQTATPTVLSPQKIYRRIYLAIAPMPSTWGAGEAQVKRDA
jgi:hypothetical protein